jgi:hypothetical protein
MKNALISIQILIIYIVVLLIIVVFVSIREQNRKYDKKKITNLTPEFKSNRQMYTNPYIVQRLRDSRNPNNFAAVSVFIENTGMSKATYIDNGIIDIPNQTLPYVPIPFKIFGPNPMQSIQEIYAISPLSLLYLPPIELLPGLCAYAAYGPFGLPDMSLTPSQISGSSQFNGVGGNSYRVSDGTWDMSQRWINGIQPPLTYWALVSSYSDSTSSAGLCSVPGQINQQKLQDTNTLLPCLPAGLISLVTYPNDDPSLNTSYQSNITKSDVGIIGIGTSASNTSTTSDMPMIYMWYSGLSYMPCSTNISVSSPLTQQSETFPTATCSEGYVSYSQNILNVANLISPCIAGDQTITGGVTNRSCGFGYLTCGYPIPLPTSTNFYILGLKTIQQYIYIYGTNGTYPTTSSIIRCLVSSPTLHQNSTVAIDTSFCSAGWYTVNGNIDFLDVVNFGYGPLVIFSYSSGVVEKMVQLSNLTIQIIDHSMLAAASPTTIPISLHARDTRVQAKIVSWKETLYSVWTPVIVGCVVTTSPRGVWLVGDVMNVGLDSNNAAQQYFELFISDQVLYTAYSSISTNYLPATNWIATLEHLPAGLSPVCIDGQNFVSTDNFTTRPVCPNNYYQNVIVPTDPTESYYPSTTILNRSAINTTNMSPYTSSVVTGFQLISSYVGIFGVGLVSGNAMRVPHIFPLDAVPERPDSINTMLDAYQYTGTPTTPVQHFACVVQSLVIDSGGEVKIDGVSYTPVVNLWNFEKNVFLIGSPTNVSSYEYGEGKHTFYQNRQPSGTTLKLGVSFGCSLLTMDIQQAGGLLYSDNATYNMQAAVMDTEGNVWVSPYQSDQFVIYEVGDIFGPELGDYYINAGSDGNHFYSSSIFALYQGYLLPYGWTQPYPNQSVDNLIAIQSTVNNYPSEFQAPIDKNSNPSTLQVLYSSGKETLVGALQTSPYIGNPAELDCVCFADAHDEYGNIYSNMTLYLIYMDATGVMRLLTGGFAWPSTTYYSSGILPSVLPDPI